ncbi:hypothetical protein HZU40_00415 (plasmid) [Mycolicibacterium fluoranthenivorans]|uniref:Uncharacterized protein n=1 Tax=Mycolicibacterium fluoranthenivorans TaxID=258505 RepID=A0A7G8P6J2_9MYCO|nr:hypothetical protein [Mycolicibacterium fluoranthenivorans]QNJ89958.1 hypothetical protein HZU40_00415 [Mycolicibacterium fluoranthenivorans]
MRTRLAQLRYHWRRIPLRTRMGLLIAVVAIAGLAWQHNSTVETAAPRPDQQAAQDGEISHDGHDHNDGGHALGEYQPDPSELAAPPDFSPEAARVTAERFATNFASPNGDRDDWLARISADVMPELLDQYRLTDIRNVPQATVAQVNGPMAADPAVPTFQVSYSDGSSVETTLEMAVGGWKVSSVVPVDHPAAPLPSPSPTAPEPVAPAAPEPAPPTSPPPGVIPIAQTTP